MNSQKPLPEINFRKAIEKPEELYKTLSSRLKAEGKSASFPEFSSTVKHLIKNLKESETENYLRNHSEMFSLHAHVLHRLENLLKEKKLFDDRGNLISTKDPCPYTETIEAIKEALLFFDLKIRDEYDHTIPLYHTDRYLHHTAHIYRSDFVYIPCHEEFTIMDFVKTRAYPFSFLGVCTSYLHADAYFNTPLDFFIHDFNHIRRLDGYNSQFMKSNNIDEQKSIDLMKNFVDTKIIPNVTITPEMPEDEKEIRQILNILFFEMTHELARTPDMESFIDELKHKPGGLSPFERMLSTKFRYGEEDKARLINNNIDSGFTLIHKNNEKPTICFFLDSFPNFITSTINKAQSDFFDTVGNESLELPNKNKRTNELFVKATKRLLKILDIDEEKLKNLNLSDMYSDSGINKLIAANEGQITYATQVEPVRRKNLF